MQYNLLLPQRHDDDDDGLRSKKKNLDYVSGRFSCFLSQLTGRATKRETC